MSFDRIAAHYRWMEAVTFGGALQRARTRWLNEIPQPARALIVGEGNGRFLCELLRVYPQIRVDCVDASASMLRLAARRMETLCPELIDHVCFVNQDILKWSPAYGYDLLVTHFFLDCFPPGELEMIISKLAAAACSGATWLLADFAMPHGLIARFHAAAWLRMMYAFFRSTTRITAQEVVDPTRYLIDQGFVPIKCAHWRLRLIKSELYVSLNPRRLGTRAIPYGSSWTRTEDREQRTIV